MSGVVLACDAPDCDARYPEKPVRSGYRILKDRHELRGKAAAAGWTINDQGDWCPEHG